MAKSTTVEHGHDGVWPKGEPASVRAAYDALLAQRRAAASKDRRDAAKAGAR